MITIKFETNLIMYVTVTKYLLQIQDVTEHVTPTQGTDCTPMKTMKEFYINVEFIEYGISIKNVDIFRMEQVFQQTWETPGIIHSLTVMIRRLQTSLEMRVGNFEYLLLRRKMGPACFVALCIYLIKT
ncbi:uncharacterized protein [Bombus fervidus]|uniref:uncharacterized protein n=1 Tax=Bombus fervidus TaxID=203811 RepID=UPI003D188306